MSCDEYKGAAWAFRELMREAEKDIASGERKGATVKFKGPNLAKIHIGWFRRRLLRGEFRRRA